MNHFIPIARILAIALLGFASLPGAHAADNSPTGSTHVGRHKVVFQVSDADAKRWGMALNNIRNLQDDVGPEGVDIELVAYGPGIGMLRFDSELADRVAEALGRGVRIVACENTMHAQKLKRDDMLPDIGFVKAGVVEIMTRQEQGYQYIRP